ncbi:hypothetical protein GCM10027422_48650 [Hymenobacter arcticus]
MNFFSIIDQLAAADADFLGRFDSRRAIFKHFGTAAQRTALAATPLFLGGLFQKAYAGTTADTPIDILNYALTLECLEADFYAKFTASDLIPAGAPTTTLGKIKQHEDGHVKLWRAPSRPWAAHPPRLCSSASRCSMPIKPTPPCSALPKCSKTPACAPTRAAPPSW